VYADYRLMLENERFDAVYICIPPFAHDEQELMAIDRDCALFIEKPVGLSFKKVQEIQVAMKRKQIISSVGYHWRYLQITDIVRKRLKQREVRFIQGHWFGGMPPPLWWRVRKHSGGQVVEQATHLYDLARYLIGEVAEVHAVATHGAMKDVPRYTVDDASFANLTFKNGIVGNIAASCIQHQELKEGLTLYGKDFSMELRYNGLTVREKGKTETILNLNNPHGDEDKLFLDAVQRDDNSLLRSSYEDAAKTLRVTLAVNESVEKGRVVRLT
jgi:predicted dehydrogenase